MPSNSWEGVRFFGVDSSRKRSIHAYVALLANQQRSGSSMHEKKKPPAFAEGLIGIKYTVPGIRSGRTMAPYALAKVMPPMRLIASASSAPACRTVKWMNRSFAIGSMMQMTPYARNAEFRHRSPLMLDIPLLPVELSIVSPEFPEASYLITRINQRFFQSL